MKKEYIFSNLEIEILLLLNDKPSYGYKLANELNDNFSANHSLQRVYHSLNKLKKKGYLKAFPEYNSMGSLRVIYRPTDSFENLVKASELEVRVQQNKQYRLNF